MPPLVSVIIPCRNHGEFLSEAVASVFRQGVEDLEVIIVDDGSTDETPAVVRSLQDARIRSTRLPGLGTSAARNAGLAEVRGRYLAYLDADDRWEPGKLQRQLALLDAEPTVAFVFTDLYRFDSADRYPQTQFAFIPELASIPTRPSKAGEGRVIEGDPFLPLVGAGQFPTWVQTCLLRWSAVRDIRYDERIGLNQDQHYMLRVFRLGAAAFLSDPLVGVRRHDRNSYRSPLPKLEADARILTLALSEQLPPAHRAALCHRTGRAWAALGYYHFWHRSPLKAARGYLTALRYPGTRLGSVAHLLALPVVPFLPGRDDGWIDEAQRPRNQSSDSLTKG